MPVGALLGTVLLLLGGLWGRGGKAEQAVNCTDQKNIFEPPLEWGKEHNLTPGDVGTLSVTLSATRSRTPYLNISWTLRFDGSIKVLNGTYITVWINGKANGYSVRCNYLEPFDCSTNPIGQQWTFYYDEIPVLPDTGYLIHAFNLPANIGDDRPMMIKNYQSPGCENISMKYSDSCVKVGSLWNPNISACILGNNVEVNFTLFGLGSEHVIKMHNCPESMEQPSLTCENIFELKTIQKNDISTTSVLIPVAKKIVCALVEVYLNIPECEKDCRRHCKKVDCIITAATEQPLDRPPEMVPGTTFFIILLASILSIFGLIAAGYCICKRGVLTPLPIYKTDLRPPVKVLLIHPSDSILLKKTVLLFADFLHGDCNAEVILDLWQKRRVAEVGHVQWLVAQKEMAHKIIFLSSSSKSAPQKSVSAGNEVDHKDADSAESMFSLALNLFCSDLINPSSRHKYMVVCFSDLNPKGALPFVLHSCPTYCLMKDVDLFCHDLHAVPRKPMFSGKKIALNNTNNAKYLQKLQKAVLEQKRWQGSPTLSAEEQRARECLVAA